MGLNQPKIPRSFFEKWVYLDLSYHSLKKMILGDVHCFIGFSTTLRIRSWKFKAEKRSTIL